MAGLLEVSSPMPETEADLGARVVGVEQAIQTTNQRLATLKTWQRQREI